MAACLTAQVAYAQDGEPAGLSDLIQRTEPAVVRIDVITKQGEGIGSGFIVSPDGVVVTNHHVIAGALSATATFQDGEKAKVRGTLNMDSGRDIAVLKIDGEGYAPLSLAKKLPPKGASVIAFGSPVGFSFSATDGIISSVRSANELRDMSDIEAGTWVQTSTPISPGNSGGPLVDRQGRVVGANTMVVRGAQNLNFAISSVDIAEVVAAAKQLSLVSLEEGAAKEQSEVRLSDLGGKYQTEAIKKLAELLAVADADSDAVKLAAAELMLVDPFTVPDTALRAKVAKGYKRLAFESSFSADLGVRGMYRWGGDYSIPYMVELLELEKFSGSEAIYAVLSESSDPRASEAIAARLGNFFDRERAWAALKRMGPNAEPGLILAVASSNTDVSVGSIRLLSRYGTEKSLNILAQAQRKGVTIVRVEAKRAALKIRTRARLAARAAAEAEAEASEGGQP